ncbi:calcium/sodium antiporter [Salegentibacter salegens]|jgi:cation:H+ antiporter|uniref:Cation:H+ antiporter n=1 Tax=Salegentibacter salegens TaxID=143223 RepID=A0A1M7NPV2_9FLAO|nr:calcium/sodium antiporter [Salegentibacter salegens]PRX40305.1 cation:H+ antiporter [Salegentibacter salegens]SHN06000.1 cation:H+ antiporter [Salegentibacter salegens]
MSIVFILIGLVLLVVGGEFLVRASVALSFKLNVSRMVIGLTVVSFATSAPELLVSLQAALSGFSDIALGNVIGSNIANLGLVLGITAIISSIAVDREFYRFNWPAMMLFSIVLYSFLSTGGNISRLEGLILFLALILFLFLLIRRSRRKTEIAVEGIDDSLKDTSNFKMIIWLIIGGVALWGGSELLVDGAVDLATRLGVSERVISVTMIAIGTSVPELAASVIAALKKEKALSLGNLIGSNIFNIGSVLGITAMIQPIYLQSDQLLTNDIFWMIGIAFAIAPLAFLPKRFLFSRYKGVILFVSYVIFTGFAFLG